jgi:hypothetical protein
MITMTHNIGIAIITIVNVTISPECAHIHRQSVGRMQ